MDTQTITLSLIDRSAGYEATPTRVRLSALANFATDVEQFLKGDNKDVDPGHLEVSVVTGSLGLLTEPLPLSSSIWLDILSLSKSELLQGIQKKRRTVFEKWQKAARANRDIAYAINSPSLERPIVVTCETDFHSDDADQWVLVERYVRGEIQDLGGSTKVNAHIRLPDGTSLAIATDRDLLRSEKANRLYKTAMVRITAKYNVMTKELRDARLVEFVEHSQTVDEEGLARMTRRGAQAWKDIPDANQWVDQLRGGSSD